MTAANLRVVSFDGFELDPITTGICEGNFLVDFDIASQFSLEAVKADPPGDFPTYVRGDPQDKVIPLHIMVRPAATPALTLDRINAMKEVFSPFRAPGYLVVIDANGNERRMLCKSLGVAPWEEHSDTAYVASLDADEPIWEAQNANTSAPAISGAAAGGYTWPITNDGNVRTYPNIELAPVASKGNANDFIRRWDVLVAWRSPLQGVDSQGLPYPVDIFDGQFDTAAEIAAARMQADCDDIRVFVDQVEVDRYVERPNTTGTSIWCSIAFEPARTAIFAVMAGGADPATGSDLEATNVEGTVGFPDVGVLLIEDEAILYRGRTATHFLNIHRAWRHTTGAGHAADTPAYLVEHEIVVMTNYSAFASPLERADRKPVIDLAASDNRKHVYGADGFYEAGTLRPGQWLRELRGTHLGAAVMAMSQTAGEVTMEDAFPSAGAPNFDALSLYTPCYVSPLATGVAMDYEVDHDMLLELFGIDAGGFETYLLRRDIRGEAIAAIYYIGAAAYQNNKILTPAERLSRLSFHARNYRITGVVDAGDADAVVVGDLNNKEAGSFTLTAAGQVRAAHILCSRSGVPLGDYDLCIYLAVFRAGVPGIQLYGVNCISDLDLPAFPNIDDATLFWVGAEEAGAIGFLPPDQYALVGYESAGTQGDARLVFTPDLQLPIYAGGSRWEEIATVWNEDIDQDLKACLLGENATQQPDAEMGSGRTIKIRNVDVHLHDDYVPAFAMGTPQDAYFWQSTLENLTTGQILTFFGPHELVAATMIRVYPSDHRVEAQHLAAGPYGIQPSYMEPDDVRDWFYLEPGVNILEYIEPSIGLGDVTITLNYRERWT